ncbi:MAG: glutamate-5-semialdehyde dehydrogenase [Clostridiales bacterium]|nr:glutamate-5-semialdehyde dehydrogenase [Clostridiales bacterium]MCD7827899.1 glutamate-5-semialdehyde dehydrogenase [Clostridiales bacterium]
MGENIYLNKIGEQAKAAEKILSCASSQLKNNALLEISAAISQSAEEILEANRIDIENAKQSGMREAMIDRLTLNKERIDKIADSVKEIAALDDPVGKTLSGSTLANGLKISKVTVPLGVIAVIYEARPNVTPDAASLCLKSGNAVILRGGKEAINSNKSIAEIMRKAVKKAGLPEDCIQLIEKTDKETAADLMRLNDYVDVLIPRGGKGLIHSVVENSTVPVIRTGEGNCHIYVDKDADINKAAEIIYNAKTSRVSVCNACESLVIHKDIAELALIAIKEKLDKKNVTIVGDEIVRSIIPDAVPASEEDWAAEYLDYKISVKVVNSIDEAIAHIEKYSTRHSESIITESYSAAEKFIAEIDSSAVYVNASTRFTDGGEFGFGAEIGISTQKLHARGPVGLPELTSYKYIVRGNGQVR